MELRFEPMGLKVETVAAYAPDEFGVTLPPDTSLSPAFSLAAQRVDRAAPAFEFLPPKPTLLEQLAAKYSSGRLRTTGAVAAGVAALVLGLFLFQQIQLWRLRAQWSHMEAKVTELQKIQDQIQQFQPVVRRQLPQPGHSAGIVAGLSRERRGHGESHHHPRRRHGELFRQRAGQRGAAGRAGQA